MGVSMCCAPPAPGLIDEKVLGGPSDFLFLPRAIISLSCNSFQRATESKSSAESNSSAVFWRFDSFPTQSPIQSLDPSFSYCSVFSSFARYPSKVDVTSRCRRRYPIAPNARF